MSLKVVNRYGTSGPRRVAAAFVFAVLVSLASLPPATAQHAALGFDLDQLIASSGAGPDPGTGDLQVRLRWAVETAIPRQWRESVPVVWSVAEVGDGQLALAYYDGRIILSPRLMSRSAEEVLFTVAHEMGHQIAYALISPRAGMPPQGFVDIAPPYNDVREGWADCVARAWTGSRLRTLSEPSPCNTEMALYVEGLLADPATLGAVRIVPPALRPAPAPASAPPAVEPVEPVEPDPDPAPGVALQPPEPAPADDLREPADRPAAGPAGPVIIVLVLVIALLIPLAAGYRLVARRNPRLLEWAVSTRKARQSDR